MSGTLIGRRGIFSQPGGAAPAFDPLDYTWTGAYRASLQSGSPSDTDAIAAINDLSGGGRDLSQGTGGSQPLWRSAGVDGQPSWEFDGTDDFVQAAVAGSQFIAAGAFEIFIVCMLDSIGTDQADGTVYANEGIFTDGDYWGIHVRSTGPAMKAWNYDGDFDINTVTIATGTPMVLAWRHDGGNIIASRDGGAENSVASGNTGDRSTAPKLMAGTYGGGTRFVEGHVSELFVNNAVMDSGDRADMIAGLKALYSIS